MGPHFSNGYAWVRRVSKPHPSLGEVRVQRARFVPLDVERANFRLPSGTFSPVRFLPPSVNLREHIGLHVSRGGALHARQLPLATSRIGTISFNGCPFEVGELTLSCVPSSMFIPCRNRLTSAMGTISGTAFMSDDRLFRTSPLRRAGASSFVPGPFSPSPFLFWSPTAAFAPFSWTQHARGCAFSLGSVVLWSSVSNGSNRWDGREGGGSPKNRSTGIRRATRTAGFQGHPPRDMVIVSRIDGEDRPLPAEDPCAGVESGHLLSSSACDARHNGSVLRGRGRSRTRPVHRSDKNRSRRVSTDA